MAVRRGPDGLGSSPRFLLISGPSSLVNSAGLVARTLLLTALYGPRVGALATVAPGWSLVRWTWSPSVVRPVAQLALYSIR
jgi:hypothetical protein